MGYWQIIVPEASVNEFRDPHLFLDDYPGYGSSPWIWQGNGTSPNCQFSQAQQWKGPQSAIITLGSGGSYVWLYQQPELDTVDYTLSFTARRSAGGAITSSHVLALVGTGSTHTPDEITSLGDGWYRVVYSWTEATGGTVVVGAAALETGMYLDAFNCEALDHRTTFIAGDQPGCQWLGRPYHSRSQRLASARQGGQVIDLADDYDLPAELSQGAGMPTIVVNAQPLIDRPGAVYQGSQAQDREILLQVYAEGSDLASLRALRQDLVAAIRPDSTNPEKPFILRCTEAGDLRQIGAVYTAGLEGFQRDGFIESIAVRMRALDPFWQSVKDYGSAISLYANDSGTYVARRKLGATWDDMGVSAASAVTVLAQCLDGKILVGGTFTTIDGVSYTNRIAFFDPITDTFTPLGRGVNNSVLCAWVDALGDIWVGGTFTTAYDAAGSSVSGTAYIAKWDWSAGQWVSIGGSGANGKVNAIKGSPFTGYVYVTGDFTTIAAGPVSANRLAVYDWSSWAAIGTGLSADGEALEWGLNGDLFIGGEFATANGVTVDGLARLSGSTFTACGGGLNATGTPICYCLKTLKDGNLMVGGRFDDAGGVSTTENIALYDVDANVFLPVGPRDLPGSTSRVYAMDYGPLGYLWIGGEFDYVADNWTNEALVRYDGYDFLRPDIQINYLTGYAIGRAILMVPDAIYIGGTFYKTGTYSWAGYTQITNAGTAKTRPVFYLKRTGASGSAVLSGVRNDTSKQELLFNCPIFYQENLRIDLRPESLAFESDFRGDLWPFLGLGSDLADLALMPGANDLIAFVDSSTVEGLVMWKGLYWSYD